MARTQPTAKNHWKGALRGRDSEELLTQAAQVEDLVAQPGWKVVTELVGKGRESVLDSLIHSPKVLEQGEYARLSGFVSGLETLEEVVDAIRAAAAECEQKLQARAAGEATGEGEEER